MIERPREKTILKANFRGKEFQQVKKNCQKTKRPHTKRIGNEQRPIAVMIANGIL